MKILLLDLLLLEIQFLLLEVQQEDLVKNLQIFEESKLEELAQEKIMKSN